MIDLTARERARRIDIARSVLDTNWSFWHGELTAVRLLVALDAMSLADAQERLSHLNACSPETAPKALEVLASDKSFEVRRAVASSPLSPPELLVQLWQDGDPNVRIAVAGNVMTPPNLLMQIVQAKPSDGEAHYAFENPALPREAMEYLLASAGKGTAKVFANPALPSAILFKPGSVAKDDDVAFWTSVNLAAAPEHLQRLAIRCIGLAQAEGASPRKFQRQIEILNVIALHPAVTELTLLNLTSVFGGSPVSDLLLSVLNRPIVPDSYWVTLSDMQEWIRRGLAEHAHCPTDVLKKLALDPDASVRAAVHGNLSAPDEVRAAALLPV